MHDLALASNQSSLLEHGADEVHFQFDCGVGLPGLEHGVHRAAHGGIEHGGYPSAMYGAHRIVEAGGGLGFEHDSAFCDLDQPGVANFGERGSRMGAIEQFLQKGEASVAGRDTFVDHAKLLIGIVFAMRWFYDIVRACPRFVREPPAYRGILSGFGGASDMIHSSR